MANHRDLDRKNDSRFLTAILVMALLLLGGILAYAYTDHSLAAAAAAGRTASFTVAAMPQRPRFV